MIAEFLTKQNSICPVINPKSGANNIILHFVFFFSFGYCSLMFNLKIIISYSFFLWLFYIQQDYWIDPHIKTFICVLWFLLSIISYLVWTCLLCTILLLLVYTHLVILILIDLLSHSSWMLFTPWGVNSMLSKQSKMASISRCQLNRLWTVFFSKCWDQDVISVVEIARWFYARTIILFNLDEYWHQGNSKFIKL